MANFLEAVVVVAYGGSCNFDNHGLTFRSARKELDGYRTDVGSRVLILNDGDNFNVRDYHISKRAEIYIAQNVLWTNTHEIENANQYYLTVKLGGVCCGFLFLCNQGSVTRQRIPRDFIIPSGCNANKRKAVKV